jgi:hypothetical protein
MRGPTASAPNRCPRSASAWEAQTSRGIGKSIVQSKGFIKKTADDMVQRALANQDNNRARVIGEMADRVVNAVDDMTPATDGCALLRLESFPEARPLAGARSLPTRPRRRRWIIGLPQCVWLRALRMVVPHVARTP